MKTTISLAFFALAAASMAAGELYSNQSSDRRVPQLNAQSLSKSGSTVSAANALFTGYWSECQNDTGVTDVANTSAGSSIHNVVGNTFGAFRVADDVSVPSGQGFIVEKVRFFGYRTGTTTSGGTPAALPAISARVEFWTGLAGAGTSLGAQSGLTPNLSDQIAVSPTENANIFRIFNTVVPVNGTQGPTPPNCARRINQIEMTLGTPVNLFGPALSGSSQYSVDFGLTTNLTTTTTSFLPMATFEGARGPSGANARQLGTAGTWVNIADAAQGTGTLTPVAQDLPFILIGKWVQSPTSITVIQGEDLSGGTAELWGSDNQYHSFLSDALSLSAEVEYSMPSPFGGGTGLSFHMEYNVERLGLAVEVRQLNHNTNSFVLFFGGTASGTDASINHTFSTNVPQYLSGPVTARVKFTPINDEDPSSDGWGHNVDEVYWTVTE